MAHVELAEVLYQRDELAAALDHATRGVTLCRQLAFTPPLAAGLAVLARIQQRTVMRPPPRRRWERPGRSS